MNALVKLWNNLETRLDALSIRERVIVGVTTLLVILLLWYQLFAGPALQRIKQNRQQAQSLEHQLQQLNAQIPPLQQRLDNDPNKQLKAQNTQLSLEIEQQERNLQDRLERLVKPEEMAGLLEQMIRQNPGMKLIAIEKLPAIQVEIRRNTAPTQSAQAASQSTASGETAEPDPTAPLLYRHGLRLQFEGDYFDTLAYLKRLEGMEKAIFFNRLQFDIEQYPKARVVLEVETLSLNKGWMGV